MKKLFITLLILTSGICLMAQKPELIELKEEVIKQACLELDQAMTSPEGSLYKLFRCLLPIKKMVIFHLRTA